MREGRVWKGINRLCEALCAILLLLIAAATLYEIVSRSVFDAPTLWAQDVSVYLMIWCAFLGLLPTDRAGQHIRIDTWFNRLPARTKSVLERASYGGIAVFCAIAAWTGAETVIQSIRFGRRSLSLFSVPMWIPQSALVCGAALFTLECLRKALLPRARPQVSPEASLRVPPHGPKH